MDATHNQVCFMCDGSVGDSGVLLCLSRTFYTKTVLVEKISQLVGSGLMVVVVEDDKLCRRCVALINRCDKLELDLTETKMLFNRFINHKYNIKSEEGLISTTEVPEYSSTDRGCDFVDSSLLGKSAMQEKKQEPVNKMEDKCKEEVIKSSIKCETKITEKCKHSSTVKPELNFVKEQKYLKEEMVLSVAQVKKEKDLSECSDTKDSTTNCVPTVEFDISCEKVSIIPPTVKNIFNTLTFKNIDSKIHSNVKNQRTNLSRPPEEKKFRKKYLKKKQCERMIKRQRFILPKGSFVTDLPPLCFKNIYPPADGNISQFYDKNVMLQQIKKEPQTNDDNCNGIKNQNASNDAEVKIWPLTTSKENITRFSCKFCNSDFENKEMLKTHEKCYYKNGYFNCSQCSKAYTKAGALQQHMAVQHTGKFKYCCELCGRGFITAYSLREHHSSVCDKDFRYVCHICGKRFSNKSTLWLHKKWHSDPRPYKCEECGVCFRNSSALAVHRRKHTGERPYKCPECALTFTSSWPYKRHRILHTKQYPFNCAVCERGFTTRFRYSTHMSRTHFMPIQRIEKLELKMAVDSSESVAEDV